MSTLVVLSYGLLVLAFAALTGGNRQLPSGVVPVYVFAVVVLFHPLQVRIQGLVDRLFFRQAYSYRGTVEATSRVLATARNTDAVADTVLTTLIGVMQIEWAVLALRHAGAAPRVFAAPAAAAAGPAAAAADGALLDHLARGPRLFAAADGLRSSSGPADGGAARLGGLGIALALPLRFRDQPLGVVLLGGKRSGAYYSGDDLDLLDTLMHQTALALTNARAYEVIGETQAELVRAERFAAVGELASAVAHGIRNPLAGIRGVAQVAREDVADDSRLARDLDMVMAEADRLERRVRTILDLSRPQAVRVVSGDLRHVLAALAESLRHRLPAGVRLEVDLPADLPLACFDAARLDEVVETVVLNAVEAMGGRGTIRLGARAANGTEPPVDVVITIADTGPGIPPHAIDRVFDLFYTTKSSGTGVGLAMARRLIEHQGGTITAASPPGGGAVFAIHLRAA
jgi:signal transduction histidine kinase